MHAHKTACYLATSVDIAYIGNNNNKFCYQKN